MPCLFLHIWSLLPILLEYLESPVLQRFFYLFFLIPSTLGSLESCHDDPRSYSWPLPYSKMDKNQDVRQATKAFKKAEKQNKDAQHPLHGREWPIQSRVELEAFLRQTDGSRAIVHENCKQVSSCLWLTYKQDEAKTPKNNVLSAKCFMQQEGKLKFQTVAKKCGCITEKWWRI